jgi:putative salt-induced outer membrane protein YdiY
MVKADEVQFKSGDRLQGKVVKMGGGKMVFASTVAGTVTLNMSDIKTFTTDDPITVVMADGSVASRSVAAAATAGQVMMADGAAAAQPVNFDAIGEINPPEVKWSGVVSASAAYARGNTKSETTALMAEATRRSKIDRSTVAAGYTHGKQRNNDTRETSTSADKWFASAQYDYFFSSQLYGYANMKYEKDRIADLDMRLIPGLGVGYQWIETDTLQFFTEAGVAYVYEKYTDPSSTEKNISGRLAYRIEKKVNDKVTLYHSLEYVPSFEDIHVYLINADAGLRAALTARLSFDAKAQLAYDSEPAPGRDRQDWLYLCGLGWTF